MKRKNVILFGVTLFVSLWMVAHTEMSYSETTKKTQPTPLDKALNEVEKATEEARLNTNADGAFICMARHRDAGFTFWLGSGAFEFEASDNALVKCKSWAQQRGKDQGLCVIQHCESPVPEI